MVGWCEQDLAVCGGDREGRWLFRSLLCAVAELEGQSWPMLATAEAVGCRWVVGRMAKGGLCGPMCRQVQAMEMDVVVSCRGFMWCVRSRRPEGSGGCAWAGVGGQCGR